MNPRFILPLLGFCALLTASLTAAERPNIIVIMADDMGYENLSLHGNTVNETPHLDALAESGMRFENAHSTPICTPSRVQIMTGIYNNRNYIEFGLLDPKALTFGNVLKDAGYNTCIAGKWQLKGGTDAPASFGFDRYCLWQLTRRPSRYPNPGLEIDGVEKDFKNGEFGPDLVTDYINDFMAEQKDSEDPFLVYYPMILPHWPFVPVPGSEDWNPTMWRGAKNEPGGYRDQEYWEEFVEYTDRMVGKLVNKLEELGIRDNTLVMFTCDNGTYTGITQELNGQTIVGGKGGTKDNGTHVPFIVSWPAVIEPGQVREELVDFSDVMPTVADAGNTVIPEQVEIDGQSLVPLFRGDESYEPRHHVYSWFERNGVREKAVQHVRTARYKLYDNGKFFDTEADPEEKTPLKKGSLPAEVNKIRKELKQVLDEHMATTSEWDEPQTAKRSKKG